MLNYSFLVWRENACSNWSNLPALLQYKNFLKKQWPSSYRLSIRFCCKNPAYLFLCCSPDGKVIDTAEQDNPFGIIEIKHRNVPLETVCSGDSQFHQEIKDSFPALKRSHRYYYQVQGHMGITGPKWCDFITYTFKGMVIDGNFFTDMLLKLEEFFRYFAKYVKEQVISKCTMISTCTATPSITSSSTEWSYYNCNSFPHR